MTVKKEKIGVQKHIRITDDTLLEQIDRVMELPEYKSFNKVICDALFYGLPMLTEKLFNVEVVEERRLVREDSGDTNEMFYATIVRLLREIVLNVTINKSILSSLFNYKETEYTSSKISAAKLMQGVFSDTPDYLAEYELDGIRGLRK